VTLVSFHAFILRSSSQKMQPTERKATLVPATHIKHLAVQKTLSRTCDKTIWRQSLFSATTMTAFATARSYKELDEDRHVFVVHHDDATLTAASSLHPPSVSAWAVTSNATLEIGTATMTTNVATQAASGQHSNDYVEALPRAIATDVTQEPSIGSDDSDDNIIVVAEAITLPAYAEQAQPYSAPAVDASTVTSRRRRTRWTRPRIHNRRERSDSEAQSYDNEPATATATPVCYTTQHPKVAAFKRRRQKRIAAAAVIGGVAGGALFAPLGVIPAGVVVGALTAGAAAKMVGKYRQRRLARRLLREQQ
jgi:hypothetical protein